MTDADKNIGLDLDSNPGPQEYRPCTLPLGYRYITKCLSSATYNPPSKLEFSPELWRQRDILKCLQMKCLQGTEAVDNHNVLFQVGTKSNR